MNTKLSTIEYLKFLLIFVLLCNKNNVRVTSQSGGHEVMCKEKEREALLTVKKSLKDADDRLSSWRNEEKYKECCQWWGVTCINSTGSVVALDLQNGELGGEISPALLELPQLSLLNLNGNNFLQSKIPKFIGSLQKLEHLHLAYSSFSGDVPSQLGNLTNLRTLNLGHNYYLTSNDLTWLSNLSLLSSLDLSNNSFSGPIPDLRASSSLSELRLSHNNLTQLPSFIGHLSNLEILDVSYNSLQGTLTEVHLSKLHNLTILDFSFNSLALSLTPDWLPPFQLSIVNLARCNVGPRFPSWLHMQNHFDRLDLSSSGISDEVPNWFWDKSQLIGHLNLSHNHISGSIPNLSSHFIDTFDVSFNNFSGPIPLFHSNLFRIQLSNNMFTGSIQSICMLKFDFLQQLDLSNNQFSGELPNCWENMAELFVLNLADNNFSGHLPQSLGALHILQALLFRNNNLTGKLPNALMNCEFLHLIDGGGNELTGNLPTWIASLRNVAFLILRQNNFNGIIPVELCSLTFIQVLDLSHNDISGNIPNCFENFTSLVVDSSFTGSDITSSTLDEVVETAIVQWKQQESEYKSILKLLKLVDLSSNKLDGNIPKEVYHLAGLGSLNLSRNNLTGSIDPDIYLMTKLETLDLSINNISGEIPVGLATIYSLDVLNLSSNSLWGKIPEGRQLQTFDASSYADNKYLCGDPLPNCQRVSTPDLPKQEDTSHQSFIQANFLGIFISSALGFIFGFWGVVGPLLLKRPWRHAYFGCLDQIGDWLYVTVTISMRRLIRNH